MHYCRMLTNIPSVHPVEASSILGSDNKKKCLEIPDLPPAGSLLPFHFPQNPHGSFLHFTQDCSLNLPEGLPQWSGEDSTFPKQGYGFEPQLGN